MNITMIIYIFHSDKVIVKAPFEIVSETEGCFFTEHGRYLKSGIGEPVLRFAAAYPYIELVMIDADEKILRKKLSEWFINRAQRVKEEK